jgi:hypothetical protein
MANAAIKKVCFMRASFLSIEPTQRPELAGRRVVVVHGVVGAHGVAARSPISGIGRR